MVVLFESKILVTVEVFTALAVYVNCVELFDVSTMKLPFAIFKKVSWTVIGVPTDGAPEGRKDVTVLELVGNVIPVTARPTEEAYENGLLLIVVKYNEKIINLLNKILKHEKNKI